MADIVHELQVENSHRPAILDELDKVEKMAFYQEYIGILSGIHAFIRQQYATEAQNISSSPDSSTGSSS